MESRRLHSGNVLLKFELHHSDYSSSSSREEGGAGDAGGGDDSGGCLLSCFPTCQTPVYYAGQMITGHLLIRPVTRSIISGVTLSFGGRCDTSWTEGYTKWSGKRVFYLERRHLIENRIIPLDTKWHRFDFEYRIPPQLPSSVREKDGHHTYYASAIVLQPHGPEIETHEAHFRLRGRLDVDSMPKWLLAPVERREEMRRSAVEKERSPGRQTAAATSDNDSASAFIQEPEEDVLIGAGLCLNRRIFVPGDRLTADGTVVNRTPVMVACTVRFQQVSAFIADYGLERRSRSSALYQHYRDNIRLVVRDLVPRSSSSSFSTQSSSSSSSSSSSRTTSSSSSSSSSSTLIIQPGKAKSFTCHFCVPKIPPSSVSNRMKPIAEVSQESRQDVKVIDDRDAIIQYKYFCTLEIVPQWSKQEKMSVPLEVIIGSHHSQKLPSSAPGTATDAAGCSRRSSRRSSGARDPDSPAIGSHHHHRSQTPSRRSREGLDGAGHRPSIARTTPAEISVFDARNEPLNYEDYFRESRRTTPSTKRHHSPREVVS